MLAQESQESRPTGKCHHHHHHHHHHHRLHARRPERCGGMSVHNRHSLNSLGRDSLNAKESLVDGDAVARASLQAADIAHLPEADYGSAMAPMHDEEDHNDNPLAASLLPGMSASSNRSSNAQSDPMANPSKLADQSWWTQLVYSFFCLQWHDKVRWRGEHVPHDRVDTPPRILCFILWP
jgi:hypothetical protein